MGYRLEITSDVPASIEALRLPHTSPGITTARKPHRGRDVRKPRRSYETGWRQFTAHVQSLESLAHPALVATFLGHLLRDGGASAQTLGSRAAAIPSFHRAAGIASPTDQRVVRNPLEGARRKPSMLIAGVPRIRWERATKPH